MIKIKNIKAKNFFSVGNSPIEIEYDKHSKTLVIGSNGCGKSSVVIDSLTFALFNKPYRKLNIPNVINSINKGKTEVTVEFEANGKEYKVIRGLKPSIFEIYENGNLLNQDSKNKDYQKILENNILRLTYKSFTNVVILGSARYTPFMSMTAADRREIIDDLLDIQVLSTMNDLTKSKISVLKKQLSEVDLTVTVLKEKLTLHKKQIKETSSQQKKQIKEQKQQIKEYEILIEQYKNDINNTQQIVDELNLQISDRSKLKQKKQKYEEFKKEFESKLKKTNTQIEFYTNNDSCPTCKQKIEEDFKINVIDKKTKKKDEIDAGLEKLQTSLEELNVKISNIEDIYQNIIKHQNEIIKLNSLLTSTSEHVIMLQNNLNKFKEEIVVPDISDLELELKEKESEKLKLEEEKNYLEAAATILKDSGVKSVIIKKYIPLLNKLINKYLQQLKLYFKFEIDENFKEVIKSRHRDEFSYNNMSNGQKMRLDLAILFAFREISKIKNSVNCNLLIMDEIMDSSLDDEGQLDLINILSMFSDQNIFIISHKVDNITESFDRLLEFDMKGNFTKMVENVL